MRHAAHSVTPITIPSVGVDWASMLLRLIAASTLCFLGVILWMMFTPIPYAGLLQFLEEDTGESRRVIGGAIAAFFAADVGQLMRGVRPRRGMVFALSGQLIVALIALYYGLKGQVFLTGLVAYGGVFWLSLISLWAVAQHNAENEYKQRLLKASSDEERKRVTQSYAVPRYQAKKLLIPSLSVIMFLTGLGQITRLEGVVAAFIQNSIGMFYYAIMLGWLLLGSGFIRLNHIQAKWLFVALFGYYMFCGLIVLPIPSDAMVSPLFILCHLVIAAEAFCIICLQTDFHEAT